MRRPTSGLPVAWTRWHSWLAAGWVAGFLTNEDAMTTLSQKDLNTLAVVLDAIERRLTRVTTAALPLVARGVVRLAARQAKAARMKKSFWTTGRFVRKGSCGCGGTCKCVEVVCSWSDGGVACRLPNGQDKLFRSEAEAARYLRSNGLRLKGS